MAKVNITATALIKFGVMKDESTRADVLKIMGRNDKLLKEQKVHNLAFARVGRVGGDDVVVLITPDCGNKRVTVEVIKDGDKIGGATYGYTSFYKCVTDDSED